MTKRQKIFAETWCCQQAYGKSHLQSVEKMVFRVGFEKDTTKDADNIIFHNILKSALNIFVSIAFYTLKYILPEVYCLCLYLTKAKHIHGSLNFAYRYMSS